MSCPGHAVKTEAVHVWNDLAVVRREVRAPIERDGAIAAAPALPRPRVQQVQLLPLLDHLPERANAGVEEHLSVSSRRRAWWSRASHHLQYLASHRQVRLSLHVLPEAVSRHVHGDFVVLEGTRRFAATQSVQRAEAPAAKLGDPSLIPCRCSGVSLCGKHAGLAEVSRLVDDVLL